MDSTLSLHIRFADGSNPYVRYGMDGDKFAKEVNQWNRSYILELDNHVNGIYYYTAYRKEDLKHGHKGGSL